VVETPEEDRPLTKIPGLNGRTILKIRLELVRWENVDSREGPGATSCVNRINLRVS
jgi:hypothetical protein